jgi:hypothetical protein
VTNQELSGSASKVPEREKEKFIIGSACLWNPHGTQTTTLSFFSNLFANQNHKMLSYQEAVIAP